MSDTTPRPRTLPWVNDDPRLLVRTDIGMFVAQPVGSTMWSTGLHVHAHLHGEPEAVQGLVSVTAKVGPDGTVSWVQRQLHYRVDHPRAEEIVAVALELGRTWVERDKVHYTTHILDQVEQERRDIRRSIRQEEETIRYLEGLQADPEEPRPWQDKDGGMHDATDEERAARRDLWARNLARAHAKKAALHEEHDGRLALLAQMADDLRRFLRHPEGAPPVVTAP